MKLNASGAWETEMLVMEQTATDIPAQVAVTLRVEDEELRLVVNEEEARKFPIGKRFIIAVFER